jgi:hypothetical protein
MSTTRGWGSRFAILFLALALTWQGFLTQGHAHFDGDGRIVATAGSASAVAVAGKSKPSPARPACPLCEEQALFGAFLLASPVMVVAPDAIAAWYAPTRYLFSAVRSLSHSWRSRAPPTLHDPIAQ